jgi:hypothetical protein
MLRHKHPKLFSLLKNALKISIDANNAHKRRKEFENEISSKFFPLKTPISPTKFQCGALFLP